MNVSRRTFLVANTAAASCALLPKGLVAAVAAATPPMPQFKDWESVRAQFRTSREYLHFAGFYIASHPEPVRAAIEGYRRAIDDNPFLVVERGLFESEADNVLNQVRGELASYLGGRPEEIALTENTTAGLTLVYNGLVLKPGDEILTTVHDHVVHHEAIRLSSERNGASVRKITLFDAAASAMADGIVDRVRASIRPETRVLGITWVHSATGIRLPIRRIADVVQEVNRGRGDSQRVILVVDGVHGIGAVDVDIASMGADFFCAGTHKWMFAPRGTGIVWAPASNWARLRPLFPSFSDPETYNAWVENRLPGTPTNAARVMPGGFHAFEHQWAMSAAFRFHQSIGRTRIADRIADLNDRCKAGLAGIGKVTLHTPRNRQLSAGINCFEVEGVAPPDVVKRLLAKKIVASTSPYAKSYVRLAAGLLNTPEEVDQAVAAVRDVAA